jgi:predicted PurR-regulated permease PerM
MLNAFKRKNNQPIQVTVSNRTIIRIVLLVVASFLFLLALRKASHAIILILTALFLAFSLNAPVHWLAVHIPGKRKGNRGIATLASFVVVIILLIGFVFSVAPPLVKQTDSFVHAAPGLVQEVHNQNSSLGKLVRRYHLEKQVNSLSAQLSSRLQKLGGSAFSTVTKITSSVFSLLIILVLTFMMLVEGPRWLTVFRRLLPKEHQHHADRLGKEMYKVVKGYVNGQVLLAAIAALVIVTPLFIFHISYPVALMVIVFICALIPMVGHTIGAAIITVVALFHSPLSAIIILAYYILYMQIEAYIIQPKIQANTTNMSPLLVFSAVIIGVTFDGLLGGLVAIPVAGCIRIIILDYIARHDLFEEDKAIAETK